MKTKKLIRRGRKFLKRFPTIFEGRLEYAEKYLRAHCFIDEIVCYIGYN